MNRMAAAVVIVLTALSLGTARAAVAHAGAATAAVKPSQEAVSPSEALERVASEQLSQLDTGDIERFLRQVDDDVAQRLPKFDIKHIMSTHGTDLMDLPWIGRELIGYLIHELQLNLRLLGELVVVAVVCTLLCLLGAGLGEDGPAAVAWAVGYMVMVVLGVRSFCVTAEIATRAVEQMTSFMYAVIPALMGTLAATGGVVTAAVVSPFMMGATAAVGTLVKTTVVPLLLMAVTLSLVGEISQRKQLSRLAALLKWAGMTVMGLAATVFVALAGMRGGLASVSDGAAAKAVKFLSGNMVPVVGKVFGDALDLVATSSLLVRGALGAFGLATLAVVCLFPVMKMTAIMLVFRIAAAVTQPLGDSRVSDCLDELGGALSSLCVCVATVGLMFFIGVSIVVGLGGVVVAVR
jgi:stage III sporulation protein AE